ESNHVTVNVQLIEALTDRHLWAKKFEGDVANIFKMRNEVVEAIAREIKTTISPEQSSRLSSARAVNPAAFEEYLLGRQAWLRQTEKGWDEALGHFNRAKEIDPGFAPAWAGLAVTYWSSAVAHWQYGWLLVCVGRPEEARKEMERAVELDPLSPVMTTDVNVPYQLRAWKSSGAEADANYDKAIAQCQKALALDPSFFLPHF